MRNITKGENCDAISSINSKLLYVAVSTKLILQKRKSDIKSDWEVLVNYCFIKFHGRHGVLA